MGKFKELAMEEKVEDPTVYLIFWGYYSCLDGGQEIKAVCSTYERAKQVVEKEVTGDGIHSGCSTKNDKLWTDGDYWISISEGYLDSEEIFATQKEIDSWGEGYA